MPGVQLDERARLRKGGHKRVSRYLAYAMYADGPMARFGCREKRQKKPLLTQKHGENDK